MADVVERLSAALTGRYRIERELGAGGMATVYLAEDLKHDRQVAIKVLKPELAAVLGAERFVQEIKTTAALSHPHILPLFDSGEADSFLYYVMPYLAGETIRDRLNREAQLSVEDAVRITREVADALDYAHRHGVVHRDIKPENILLHDGRPMVMDFGIALAVSAAAGGRMTETGLSLGTPHYMSPEQATAEKDITARSDVYSLASVLYELLAGQPPHLGGTAQQIIMKIIAEPAPPVTALRKSVPPNVAAAVAKALEKLPADRFDTAKAFSDALANASFSLQTVASGGMATPQQASRLRKVVAILAATTVLFAGAAALGWMREAPRVVSRYRIAFPDEQQLALGTTLQMAWAPDASWFVYRGPGTGGAGFQLWVKQRDRADATPLAGTDGAAGPAVSRDGRRIAFTVGSELRTVPSGGGPSTTLNDSAYAGVKPLWLEDGSIVFMDTRVNLRKLAWNGGGAAVLYEGGFASIPLEELPSGRGILFLRCELGCDPVSELWVLDGRTGEARQIYPEASWAAFRDGLLLYSGRDGTVYGVPFDLTALAPAETPVPLFGGVRVQSFANIAVAPGGSIIYVAGEAAAARDELAWIERDGRIVPVDSGWSFVRGVNPGLAISPDGMRVALNFSTDGNTDVWVKEFDGGVVSRITRDPLIDARPRWSPDGAWLTFSSNRHGGYNLYTRRADGIGTDSLLLDLDMAIHEVSVSRDGNWEILRVGVTTTGRTDIFSRHRGVDSTPQPLLAEPFRELMPALSPDGRWLAYVSDETGRNEVFVRPFPDVNAGKWKVSNEGGISPVWAHSGRELFFLDEDNALVSQPVGAGASFDRGAPQRLFALPARYLRQTAYASFDVSPDDTRFLFMLRTESWTAPAAPAIMIVDNWLDEVKRTIRSR